MLFDPFFEQCTQSEKSTKASWDFWCILKQEKRGQTCKSCKHAFERSRFQNQEINNEISGLFLLLKASANIWKKLHGNKKKRHFVIFVLTIFTFSRLKYIPFEGMYILSFKYGKQILYTKYDNAKICSYKKVVLVYYL